MKKLSKSILLFSLLTPMLASCSSQNTEGTILRVLNSEDYIYINDPKNGYDEPDLIQQFSDFIASDPELSAKYGKVTVVYDTADTMENIYSEMQTGKTNYDLICASDYIVAKMARYGLIKHIDKDLIPNYFGYYDEEEQVDVPSKASALLSQRLNEITTTPIQGDYKGQLESLGDYAVGYMWGTLGILFNPTFDAFIKDYKNAFNKGIIDEDEYNQKLEAFTEKMLEDMSTYDSLWNDNSFEDKEEHNYDIYKGSMSIKDSMRDTFAFGIMHAYRDSYKDKDGNVHEGFEPLREKYYSGELSLEEYNEEFSKLFNYVVSKESNPQQVINEVAADLEVLKRNVFGLEVDSGKQDIVTGKIGINMAWSGDAVYSMDQAEDPEQVTETNELYYAVPKTGSNLWMDIWVMPNLPEGKQSDLQSDLAHLFLDYLSSPEIAAKNMDYTGYTSFIAGDDILELVRDWYDSRCDEVYFYDEEEDEYYDVVAVDNTISEPESTDLDDGHFLWFEDCISTTHDDSIDTYNLFYVTSYKENPDYDPEDEESLEFLVDTFEPLMIENDDISNPQSERQKIYGDIYLYDIDEDELYDHIDLSYIFEGTLSDDYSTEDMMFYSDDYAYYIIESEVEDGIDEICAGRQFYTQYPDKETINRCAVMRDYEEYNDAIMKMWEDFKSEPLPIWAIVLFAIMIAAIIGGIAYYFISKKLKVKLRKLRKSDN